MCLHCNKLFKTAFYSFSIKPLPISFKEIWSMLNVKMMLTRINVQVSNQWRNENQGCNRCNLLIQIYLENSLWNGLCVFMCMCVCIIVQFLLMLWWCCFNDMKEGIWSVKKTDRFFLLFSVCLSVCAIWACNERIQSRRKFRFVI